MSLNLDSKTCTFRLTLLFTDCIDIRITTITRYHHTSYMYGNIWGWFTQPIISGRVFYTWEEELLSLLTVSPLISILARLSSWQSKYVVAGGNLQSDNAVKIWPAQNEPHIRNLRTNSQLVLGRHGQPGVLEEPEPVLLGVGRVGRAVVVDRLVVGPVDGATRLVDVLGVKVLVDRVREAGRQKVLVLPTESVI